MLYNNSWRNWIRVSEWFMIWEQLYFRCGVYCAISVPGRAGFFPFIYFSLRGIEKDSETILKWMMNSKIHSKRSILLRVLDSMNWSVLMRPSGLRSNRILLRFFTVLQTGIKTIWFFLSFTIVESCLFEMQFEFLTVQHQSREGKEHCLLFYPVIFVIFSAFAVLFHSNQYTLYWTQNDCYYLLCSHLLSLFFLHSTV